VEAVVLPSIRSRSIDVAWARTRKGVRRTKSRFAARLEPLSHVELMLHAGSRELQTVTGVELIPPHSAAREDSYRLGVGLVGLEGCCGSSSSRRLTASYEYHGGFRLKTLAS